MDGELREKGKSVKISSRLCAHESFCNFRLLADARAANKTYEKSHFLSRRSIYSTMKSARARTAFSIIRDYVIRNKKAIVCFGVMLAAGLVIGIVSTINGHGDGFERIPRSDMEFGSVKMFFYSNLALVLGYAVILISCYGTRLVFLAVAPFLALGIFFGKYICLLIACYEVLGLINLFMIYIPFFLAAFVCLTLAAVALLNNCGCSVECGGKLRPSVAEFLKILGVNIAINFVLFIIIGSFCKVIIVVGY